MIIKLILPCCPRHVRRWTSRNLCRCCIVLEANPTCHFWHLDSFYAFHWVTCGFHFWLPLLQPYKISASFNNVCGQQRSEPCMQTWHCYSKYRRLRCTAFTAWSTYWHYSIVPFTYYFPCSFHLWPAWPKYLSTLVSTPLLLFRCHILAVVVITTVHQNVLERMSNRNHNLKL